MIVDTYPPAQATQHELFIVRTVYAVLHAHRVPVPAVSIAWFAVSSLEQSYLPLGRTLFGRDPLVIKLQSGQPNEELVTTTLHEFQHCLDARAGLEAAELEERAEHFAQAWAPLVLRALKMT